MKNILSTIIVYLYFVAALFITVVGTSVYITNSDSHKDATFWALIFILTANVIREIKDNLNN